LFAQANWSEPDYKKLAVETGAHLEVWSWVVGLDSVAKDFEKEFPNIKVKVNNIAAARPSIKNCRPQSKLGQAHRTSLRLNTIFFHHSSLQMDWQI
jgi:hypothetical protein